MEPLQNNQQTPATPVSPQPSIEVEQKEINAYPIIRHLLLIICVLLVVAIILFLFYQNGKSIYDNGL